MFCAPGPGRSQSRSQGFIAHLNCGIKSNVWGTPISAGAAVLFTFAKIKHTKLQAFLAMQQGILPENTWKKIVLVGFSMTFIQGKWVQGQLPEKCASCCCCWPWIKTQGGKQTWWGLPAELLSARGGSLLPKYYWLPGTLQKAVGPLTQHRQEAVQASRPPVGHRDAPGKGVSECALSAALSPFCLTKLFNFKTQNGKESFSK